MQKKKGRQILAVIMATMMAAQSANAASWVQDYVGWWWQDNDNSYPVNQWREVNGAWYWFDDNGYATALKIGTATITATSSRRTATCFIRVTEVAVGHVKSAKLLIGGQSELDSPLRIKNGNQFELSQEVIIE